VGWIRRFILAKDKRHPRQMGAPEVEAFLSRLATKDQVAASTQNQALSALLFLYREVLNIQLPWMEHIRRAKVPERLPVVLSRAEVAALLGEEWRCRLSGALALRMRDPSDGMAAASHPGPAIRAPRDRGARWQEQPGSDHPAGPGTQTLAAGTGRGSPPHPPGGLPGGLWAACPMLSRASIRMAIASLGKAEPVAPRCRRVP
jgi:hypothetical protein